MKKTNVTILAGLLLAAAMSFAQPDTSGSSPRGMGGPGMGQGHRPGPPSPEEHVKMLDKELNLTADQKTKITKILEDQQAEMKKMREDTSATREQKMATMREHREATHNKIRAVLNPDQQKKFDTMRERMEQEHMGRGMGMRQQEQNQQAPPPPK